MKELYDYINAVDKHAVIAEVKQKKGIAFICNHIDWETREELCKMIIEFLNNKKKSIVEG